MAQPESPAALLTCIGRHTAAHPPAADGLLAYPESGPSLAPGDLRFGCPEPCTRQANPPEHQCLISDLWCSTCARCASRPDFGLGGWRPQVQNLGRDRLRPFGRGRGWGKVSRPPHWKRANLATRRAPGWPPSAPFHLPRSNLSLAGRRVPSGSTLPPFHAQKRIKKESGECSTDLTSRPRRFG